MNDISQNLPPLLTDRALDRQLEILPEYDPSIIFADKGERLEALQDIYDVFIPSNMAREIYTKLYLSLKRSLKKKTGIAAVRQFQQNRNIVRQRSYESIIGGSSSFTIIGPSGIGKSSAVSSCIQLLSYCPILELGNTTLIPCLQVQAPADCSVKGLLLEILRKTDEAIGTSYYYNAQRAKATVDTLVGSVSQAALNHCGILVVDEIQNVVNGKNGRTIIGTLTQLINNSGVSICMIGTPDSAVFFEQADMLARRSLGLTYGLMEYNDEFKEFCSRLSRYCYVKNPVTFNESMMQWLYLHSGGVKSNVVSLLHDAQEIAILNDYEHLDLTALNNAYGNRMNRLHDFINIKPVSLPQAKPKETTPVFTKDEQQSDIKKSETIIYEIMDVTKKKDKNMVTELNAAGIKVMEVAV